ncbi:response regulator [Terrimonas sp. NA20]|uniref:histidine kinase n=1 Tax=Terrimonas ginsenosidimutans TaxID=2908004 RepID=A0ABS9L048_9BACT|nr:response regulator [Terrimonas ginsenosidimutans]MCG2617943.1 response regulator [Terrimonas ginsenosidimutans]
MKMSLSRRILLGFAVCTCILVAVAIFSFRNSERFMRASQMVAHTHEVMYEFDLILAATLDAESAARGYIITGDRDHLQNYRSATSSAVQHLDNAAELTRDNSIQQDNVAKLRPQLELRRKNLDEAISRRSQDLTDASTFISKGEGKLIQDEIRRITINARNIEIRLLEQRKLISEHDASNFTIVFISLLIVIGLTLLIVYWIITSNLKALRRSEQETAEKNWILTANLQLNEKIRGETVTDSIAQAALEQLCSYLDARVGAIYVANYIGQLKLAGAYGLPAGTPDTLSLGEGLAGQAAAQKKPVLFKEVPPDYLRISSGTGQTVPREIICLPLLAGDEIRGVVELGSVHSFSAIEQDLLNRLSETIAIAIAASQSRQRTEELLAESQQQAEELEAQQEELKQFNEELQEKTDLLEKSEGELKAQQEELQQINEELEEKANMLEEQRNQLENARIELETKAKELELTSKYKTEFLANMSHELRTPLNSILILSKILSENKEHRLNDKEVEFARNIYNSGNDQLKLINEILDLSKVEAGKMELEISELTLDEIESGNHSTFDELAKSKFIEFSIDRDPSIDNYIVTDKQRLQQILRNLLSNAFKFTERGGKVVLSVQKAPATLRFRNPALGIHAEVLSFSVKDTGIGIPENKLEMVFEAFQQADGSTKRKFGGTGLGLSISRELAHALGGELIVTSEEGIGSTFTLFIPQRFSESFNVSGDRRYEAKEKEPQQKITEEKTVTIFPKKEGEVNDDRHSISEKDKVVLIMEDDPSFASLLLDFVRERNYKAIVAVQGNTGLSYARYYKPDAILLDMKLPVMDGSEVLKYLKNDPSLRHIPVQIISGYDLKKESLELGAFDFLQKPVDPNNLMNAFDRIEEFTNRKMKKLLVVEDNEQQNTAIRELIGNGDVKSYPAFSGQQAVDMLNGDHFDCIIVDLGLPDMSGFDLLEKIKDTETLKRIPIIVYTGKDLTREENMQLMKYANTVVLKTANSHERLLDETMLFLHRVESRLPKEKQTIIRKLHRTDEVLVKKKVLVVDDDIRNIYSLTNVLEEEGMECIVADNGKRAVEELQEHPEVDIILMDIMMPEMDGFEATRAIRAIPHFEKLPIIALTAKAIKGDREKCLDAGMSDYISKPVNIEQLLSLMRVWLYK